MQTTDFSTTIGNVTYFNFPTYSELCGDRSDVRQEMMIFFRLIGLCSPQQINVAIGNPPDDVRIKHILNEVGVDTTVGESQSEENRQYAESLQREYLGDDPNSYRVDVSLLNIGLRKIGYSKNCKKVLETLLKAEQADRGNDHFQKASQPNNPPKTEPPQAVPPQENQPGAEQPEDGQPQENRSMPPKTEIKTFVDLERAIKTIAADCPISPIHDFKEARKTDKYFSNLLRYFPNVPAGMLIHYLFRDGVSTFTVQDAIRNSGIRRGKGFHVSGDSIVERAAFVAWAEGDWSAYLEREGPAATIIEALAKKAESGSSTPVTRHRKAVLPKAVPPKTPMNDSKQTEATEVKATTPPEAKATVPDTEQKPRAKSNGPALGIIHVSGTVSEILALLMQLENDARVEVKKFMVER